MPAIYTTKGEAVEVDEDVFQWAQHWTWRLVNGYAVGYLRSSKHGAADRRDGVYLHREIMGHPAGLDVHHKDGNKQDCRRSNLEMKSRADHSRWHLNEKRDENVERRYQCPPKRGAPYKGVCWHKRIGRWVVQFKVDGVNQTLGRFDDPEEAAVVYDTAVIVWRGGRGYSNFIPT